MKMSYNHPFIVTSEPMTMMRGKKMGLSTINDPLNIGFRKRYFCVGGNLELIGLTGALGVRISYC